MKSIKAILPAPSPHWVGNGFHVHPVFHHLAFSEELSPFLMLDYAAPKKFGPTNKRLGVGKHPHRGFETVTIAFQGEVEHGDSLGNRDVIKTGDVQWMTAARGIIHEEFHSTEFAKTGGVFEMVQLWVNLPKDKKMIAPSYQPLQNKDIPKVPIPSTENKGESLGTVRVIAGTYGGHKGPAHTHSPVELWDINVEKKAGEAFEIKVPEGQNTIVFVRKGGVVVTSKEGDEEIGPQSVALMKQGGTTLKLKAVDDGTQVLLLSGEPLNEPIASRGPFVMNTQQELNQAARDYQSGKLGR